MIKNEIELCGLLWDRDNLTIGGYEKDGRHYYTWEEAMDAARSVGKRLPTGEEWTALCDLGSTWDDELKGRWFGGNHDSDHKGSLFLPAAGLRNNNSGQHELQRLLLVLVAVLRRRQRRGHPRLLLGLRQPAELQRSRPRLQRALRAGQRIVLEKKKPPTGDIESLGLIKSRPVVVRLRPTGQRYTTFLKRYDYGID